MTVPFRPLVLVASLLLAAGCGSPLFAYDPTGAAAPTGCASDADCVAGRCETASGRCFPCLADADCGDGRVCAQHACEWAAGRCGADADCADAAGTPRCAPGSHRCVQCVDAADCGGSACSAGSCTPRVGCTPAGPGDLARLSVGSLRGLASEASARDYAACVTAGCCDERSRDEGCTAPTDDLPANCVSLLDAENFCRFVGGRVPSGSEWSRLAGGENDGRFPWGASPVPSCDLAVITDEALGEGCGSGGPAAACSKSAGLSTGPDGNKVGFCDLAGNLWEWTAETGPASARVLRGGAFTTENPEALRNRFHDYAVDPTRRLVDAGIRCVW